MTKKVKEQDEDVQTGAKFIFKNQGPMFLTVKFNKDKLMETLDWTKVDYNNLLFLKNDTKAAYKDFTRAYKMNIVWFLWERGLYGTVPKQTQQSKFKYGYKKRSHHR